MAVTVKSVERHFKPARCQPVTFVPLSRSCSEGRGCGSTVRVHRNLLRRCFARRGERVPPPLPPSENQRDLALHSRNLSFFLRFYTSPGCLSCLPEPRKRASFVTDTNREANDRLMLDSIRGRVCQPFSPERAPPV